MAVGTGRKVKKQLFGWEGRVQTAAPRPPRWRWQPRKDPALPMATTPDTPLQNVSLNYAKVLIDCVTHLKL